MRNCKTAPTIGPVVSELGRDNTGTAPQLSNVDKPKLDESVLDPVDWYGLEFSRLRGCRSG